MKKSLIALAVLAASGASFAQVTVTGNLTYGYQSTTAGGNGGTGSSETAGMGAETAKVVFGAQEDLGGGFAAKASMRVNTTPHGTTTGDDTSLTLVTPVGGLVMGTVKSVDYLSGGIAGVDLAYYTGWESTTNAVGASNFDKIFTARTPRDYIAFAIPVGAFTFAIAQYEAAYSTSFGTGITGATAATSGGVSAPLTAISATYSAGPVVANGTYQVYKNQKGFGNGKDTTKLAASYDLGVAKLGGGLVITNLDNTGITTLSPKVTDYLLAAKIPMGASSFGLTYASRTVADVGAATSSTGTGYSLEYGYAMSKRTSVIANYARWTAVGAAGVAANQDASSQYNLLLSHSF
jgi:hypothetical protein